MKNFRSGVKNNRYITASVESGMTYTHNSDLQIRVILQATYCEKTVDREVTNHCTQSVGRMQLSEIFKNTRRRIT